MFVKLFFSQIALYIIHVIHMSNCQLLVLSLYTVGIVDPLKFYASVFACRENFKSYLSIYNTLNYLLFNLTNSANRLRNVINYYQSTIIYKP